jgi:hypothetical protein
MLAGTQIDVINIAGLVPLIPDNDAAAAQVFDSGTGRLAGLHMQDQ